MEKVKDFCRVLAEVFKITNWDIYIKEKTGSGNADVSIDHRYQMLTLSVYPNFFKEDVEYQARTLIHEFCHLFNVPLYNLLEKTQEGKMITQEHADDILENCNMRAERVIIGILTSNKLKEAYEIYTRGNPERPKPNKKQRTKGNRTKRSN